MRDVLVGYQLRQNKKSALKPKQTFPYIQNYQNIFTNKAFFPAEVFRAFSRRKKNGLCQAYLGVVIPQYINKMATKLRWTQEEQEYLVQVREQVGENRWVEIAKSLNIRFAGKTRTGKQCRERFLNFLQREAGTADSTTWSAVQTENLFKLFSQKGPRWTEIAKNTPGRSENTVKNKFYSSLRKLLRYLNAHSKHKSRENLKPLKVESLSRILNLSEQELREDMKAVDDIIEIKAEILQLAGMEEKEMGSERIAHLGELIRRFNSQYRTFLIRRYKKYNSRAQTESKRKKKWKKPIQTACTLVESSFELLHPAELIYHEKQSINCDNYQDRGSSKEQEMRFQSDLDTPALSLVGGNPVKKKAFCDPQNLEKEYCDIVDQMYKPSQVFYPY